MIKKFLAFPVLYILIAFAAWAFCFKGYFLGHYGFTSDAVSYYEHIRFFLMNLKQGHFPLWDPYWSGGVPNDFFLRRFCPYNPFYSLVILLNIIGIPYFTAYVLFLAGYLFFGMSGFYLLCRRLTGDEMAAFVAFLVLLFSALSTRIFDSYMIFVVTPMVWFFYFLIRFCATGGRFHALGLTLFSMILLTTYIPFYFLIVIFSFAAAFTVVYLNKISGAITGAKRFFSKDRLIAALCLVAILLSIFPGLAFFKQAGRGEISIPGRHFNTTESHALAVQDQAEDSWAVPEEFFFSVYFHDLKRITFAIVYVPCFAFILLALGAGLKATRLLLFLAVWGGLLLLLTSPFASPLYSVLRDRVFLFKYFRNLHFLLWFALFPIFALFVGELFRSFREEAAGGRKWFYIWILIVHGVLFWLVFSQPYVLWTTKATILLSGGICLAYVLLSGFRARPAFVAAAFLLLIIIQPIEVYHYFLKNLPKMSGGFYDDLGHSFQYRMHSVGEGKKEGPPPQSDRSLTSSTGGLYYATAYYNELRMNLPLSAVADYEQYRFIAYDQVEKENSTLNWSRIATLWLAGENKAIIESGYNGPLVIGEGGNSGPERFGMNVSDFRIVNGDSDTAVLDTDFLKPRLLVFNDAYHPGWRARVNGRPTRVWRVNGAFKGVVVPDGPARVVFEFGVPGQRMFNVLLMAIFYGLGLVLCVLAFRRHTGFPVKEPA